MTTYSNRETVVRTVEYGVKAGADIGTFSKIEAIAWADFCRRTGAEVGGNRYDDWATVVPLDEETVIRFEVKHLPTAADEALVRVRKALTDLAEKTVLLSGSGRDGRIDASDLQPLHDALNRAGS